MDNSCKEPWHGIIKTGFKVNSFGDFSPKHLTGTMKNFMCIRMDELVLKGFVHCFGKLLQKNI